MTAVSPPNFVDWRAQNRTLESIGIYSDTVLTLSGGTEPLRVSAAVDRCGGPDDARREAGVWTRLHRGRHPRRRAPCRHARPRRLAAPATGAIGTSPARRLQSTAARIEVAGVMPAGFDFPGEAELWVPMVLTPDDLSANQRGAHYVSAVGRLRPGVSIAQAQQDIDRIEQEHRAAASRQGRRVRHRGRRRCSTRWWRACSGRC